MYIYGITCADVFSHSNTHREYVRTSADKALSLSQHHHELDTYVGKSLVIYSNILSL